MLKPNTATINRTGEVAWQVDGDYHCSETCPIIRLKYELNVKCSPKLDNRGFLFDQAEVDRWIKQLAKKVTLLSCEKLATTIGQKFQEWVKKESPSCDVMGLTVKLSPEPYAAAIAVNFGAL